MSSFNPGWPLAPSMTGQPTYQSPEINFGGPQHFNSSIPSHTATQQHQWNLGNYFPPINPSLSNFGSTKLLDPTGFSHAAGLAGIGQQSQFSGATGSSQSNVPLFSQQSATHGASVGVQSPQANRQAAPLAFQGRRASQNEHQATRNLPGIPSHPGSEAVVDGIRTSPTNDQATQGRLPIPAQALDELNLGPGEGTMRCVSHSTSVQSSLNSLPVCPTGLPS